MNSQHLEGGLDNGWPAGGIHLQAVAHGSWSCIVPECCCRDLCHTCCAHVDGVCCVGGGQKSCTGALVVEPWCISAYTTIDFVAWVANCLMGDNAGGYIKNLSGSDWVMESIDSIDQHLHFTMQNLHNTTCASLQSTTSTSTSPTAWTSCTNNAYTYMYRWWVLSYFSTR